MGVLVVNIADRAKQVYPVLSQQTRWYKGSHQQHGKSNPHSSISSDTR